MLYCPQIHPFLKVKDSVHFYSFQLHISQLIETTIILFLGNVLKFANVKKEHRGTYYCVATNVVGQGARRNVDVEVEFAPVMKIPRKRVGQALQFDMDLECYIEAYPPPAIKWYIPLPRLSVLCLFQVHFYFRRSFYMSISSPFDVYFQFIFGLL